MLLFIILFCVFFFLRKQNPATYMLEVIGDSDIVNKYDFVEVYKQSELCHENTQLLAEMEHPTGPNAELPISDISSDRLVGGYVATRQTQVRELVKKFWRSYWRSPQYNYFRLLLMVSVALILGI